MLNLQAVDDAAETSESHGDDPKPPLRTAVLRRLSLRSGPVETEGKAETRPEEEDSVSVNSIDPHLLDSIGESPRGVSGLGAVLSVVDVVAQPR